MRHRCQSWRRLTHERDQPLPGLLQPHATWDAIRFGSSWPVEVFRFYKCGVFARPAGGTPEAPPSALTLENSKNFPSPASVLKDWLPSAWLLFFWSCRR